jgi:hypothetical protein
MSGNAPNHNKNIRRCRLFAILTVLGGIVQLTTLSWTVRMASKGRFLLDQDEYGTVDLWHATKATKTVDSGHVQITDDDETTLFFTPRVLIGILSDSRTDRARGFRDRQRKVFEFWKSDHRFCSVQEFLVMQKKSKSGTPFMTKEQVGHPDYDQYGCQVIYAFVLGAYSSENSTRADDTISTLRLQDTPDQPLLLDHALLRSNDKNSDQNNPPPPPYQDVIANNDGIFLKIIENMNNGKTPTYLYWASQFSKQWNIPYIAKCDGDAFLQMDLLFEFLQEDLPPIPVIDDNHSSSNNIKQPSVLTGYLWHNPWNFQATVDQTFWSENYFRGLHLYLMGGFYLMNQALAEEATQEARKYENIIPLSIKQWSLTGSHGYLEGVEDHDAIAMIDVGHYGSLRDGNKGPFSSVIQWITMPKDLFFFNHPVKKLWKWKVLCQKEKEKFEKKQMDKQEDSSTRPLHGPGQQHPQKVHTLVLVYGAITPELREQYRHQLLAQSEFGGNCSKMFHDNNHDNDDFDACGIQYLFVTGKKGQYRPGSNKAKLKKAAAMLATSLDSASASLSSIEEDVLVIDEVNDNDHLTLGLVALDHLQEFNCAFQFDVVILCKSSSMLNASLWTNDFLSTAQYSLKGNHEQHLLIGDLRERNTAKSKQEFTSEKDPIIRKFFQERYAGIHLYLGSDCFAFSTSLIPVILKSVYDPQVKLSLKGPGHLGHDLVYLAYAADQIKLHWMAVPNAMQFWSPSNITFSS